MTLEMAGKQVVSDVGKEGGRGGKGVVGVVASVLYVCMYVFMYVCMYVCIFMYVYMSYRRVQEWSWSRGGRAVNPLAIRSWPV